jgi:hypothetical protein
LGTLAIARGFFFALSQVDCVGSMKSQRQRSDALKNWTRPGKCSRPTGPTAHPRPSGGKMYAPLRCSTNRPFSAPRAGSDRVNCSMRQVAPIGGHMSRSRYNQLAKAQAQTASASDMSRRWARACPVRGRWILTRNTELRCQRAEHAVGEGSMATVGGMRLHCDREWRRARDGGGTRMGGNLR